MDDIFQINLLGAWVNSNFFSYINQACGWKKNTPIFNHQAVALKFHKSLWEKGFKSRVL